MSRLITVKYSIEDGGYIATCFDFPLCSAFGNTPDEAKEELKIVIKEISHE